MAKSKRDEVMDEVKSFMTTLLIAADRLEDYLIADAKQRWNPDKGFKETDWLNNLDEGVVVLIRQLRADSTIERFTKEQVAIMRGKI